MLIKHPNNESLFSLRAYSHKAKVGAKAKKIKRQENKEQTTNNREKFAFVHCEWALNLKRLSFPYFLIRKLIS